MKLGLEVTTEFHGDCAIGIVLTQPCRECKNSLMVEKFGSHPSTLGSIFGWLISTVCRWLVPVAPPPHMYYKKKNKRKQEIKGLLGQEDQKIRKSLTLTYMLTYEEVFQPNLEEMTDFMWYHINDIAHVCKQSAGNGFMHIHMHKQEFLHLDNLC